MSHRMLPLGLVLGAAALSCAAPSSDDADVRPDSAEIEETLDLTVDRVEAVRGTLRVSATMTDGSPDVSVWLSGSCDRREVGRGIATSTHLVWTLTADELGDAIGCNVQVVARAREGTRAVRRVAEVAVEIGVTAAEEDDVVRLEGASAGSEAVSLRVQGARSQARLSVRGLVLDAVIEDDEGAESAKALFEIPNDAFARAVVARRDLELTGAADATIAFTPSLRVGGTDLDAPEADVASEGESETEADEPEGPRLVSPPALRMGQVISRD